MELEEGEYELKKRRIALCEKRFDLDRQRIRIDSSERRGQPVERSKLLDVLAASTKCRNLKDLKFSYG